MRRLALIAIALLMCAPASAQVQLRYKFSPDQIIRQKMTQVMTSSAEVQGQKFDTSINQTMFLEQTVESVEPDGSAKVRQKINRIQMSMKAPLGQGYEYDSNDETTADAIPGGAGKILQQLAGIEFQARILPTGKLVDIKIPEEMTQALKGLPGSPFGDGSEEAIKQFVGQSTVAFPDKPLSPGESWTDDRTMKMPFGEMKMHYTNTYEGTNDDGLQVIKLDLGLELIPAENQPIKMTFKDSDAKGTILFDNSLGQITRSEMTQNMTIDASVGGRSFEQKIKQTVAIERLPDADDEAKAE